MKADEDIYRKLYQAKLSKLYVLIILNETLKAQKINTDNSKQLLHKNIHNKKGRTIMSQNTKLISILTQMSVISDKLYTATNDKKYYKLSIVSNRLAELEMQNLPTNDILLILRNEGYITDDMLAEISSSEQSQPLQ